MAVAMSDDRILPQEIVVDILSRLPVKSLCRFKCVSPSWKTLISDPHFARTHLNRTKTQNPKNLDQSITISSIPRNLYSVDFADLNPIATKLDFSVVEQLVPVDEWLRVSSSCDGLLLVSYASNLFLLNPSTRECKVLPTPTPPVLLDPVHGFYLYGFGLGYNSSTNDYNAVRLSCKNTSKYEYAPSDIAMVDVYSVKTNAWSRVRDTQYVFFGSSFCGVFLNGSLHWLCQRTGSYVIGAFNLADNNFMEVPLPASLSGCYMFDYWVKVVGGCLCLVTGNVLTNEVWMMEEYGVGDSWTKLVLDLLTGMPGMSLLCQLAGDKLLFEKNWPQMKLVVYDRKKETLRDMVVDGIPSVFSFGQTYVESLVSPSLRGGMGTQ